MATNKVDNSGQAVSNDPAGKITDNSSQSLDDQSLRIQELEAEITRLREENGRIEEALRLAEEKFTKVFYNGQTPMAISRLKDHTYIDVNDAYLQVMGFSREEVTDKGIFVELNICCTDEQERQAIFNEFHKNGCVNNVELKVRKKNGEFVYALASFYMIEINGEKCRLTTAIDITERKKAEEALRKSQELFYKTFNANPLPMIIATKDGTHVEVNEAHSKRSGYTREELIGINVADTNLWADLKERDKYRAELEKKGFVENFEFIGRNKSGELFNILLSGASILWSNEPCILSICNDIT